MKNLLYWIGKLRYRIPRFLSRVKSSLLAKSTILIRMKQLSLDLQMIPVKYSGNPHKPGDIVYILFDAHYDERFGSKAFPYIGSAHEIDCKVLEAYEAPGSVYDEVLGRTVPGIVQYYNIITGRGQKFDQIPQRVLIPARELPKYKGARIYVLMEDTEIAPAGTQFSEIGEFVQNDELGIYIHSTRFAESAQYFKQL